MNEKNKFIIWLIALIILVVAVLVGYVLVHVSVRIGMHETAYLTFVSRGIQGFHL